MQFANSGLLIGKMGFLQRQDMLKWCRVGSLNFLPTKIGGDMYETHEAFIKWAQTYDHDQDNGRNLQDQKRFLSELKTAPLIIEDNLSESQLLKMSLNYIDQNNY